MPSEGSPPVTRVAAIVQAAVFDAVNGITPHTPITSNRPGHRSIAGRGGRAGGVCIAAARPESRSTPLPSPGSRRAGEQRRIASACVGQTVADDPAVNTDGFAAPS
jgi:hypothetical protein